LGGVRAGQGDGRRAAFKTPFTESMSRQERLAYYLERAEAGYPSYQYFASQEICASDGYPDRQVQALKWLLIAYVLHDASVPKEVRLYLSSAMTEADTARALMLASDWFAQKARTDIPQDESLWSRELLEALRPNSTAADAP
jgi:hypothetical protein